MNASDMKRPKDNAKSSLFRVTGNFHFAKKTAEGYSIALKFYNKAICFAPNESENLCIAYANRSAIYLKLNKYKECLDNINLVYKINNYPSRLWDKLKQREIKCLLITIENNLAIEESIEATVNFPPHDKVPFIRNCIEMRQILKYGNHIVTNCDLNGGEIIAISKPFCTAKLGRYQYERCENCCSECSHNLIPCTSCTTVMFCGEKCLKEATDGFHKYECTAIDLINYVLPYQHEKLALRIITWGLSIFGNIDKFLDMSAEALKENTTIFDINHNSDNHRYAVVSSLKKASPINTLQNDVNNLFIVCNRILKAGNILSTKQPKEFKRTLLFILEQHLLMVERNEHLFSDSSCRVVNKDLTSHDGKYAVNHMSGIYPFMHLLSHSSSPNVMCIRENQNITSVVIRPITAGERLFNNGVHCSNKMTCLPIHSEFSIESVHENDHGLIQKTKMRIDELSDLNDGESELMKTWNIHIMSYGYTLQCPFACKMFIENKGVEIIQKNLYNHFVIHLCNLCSYGDISSSFFYKCIHKLKNLLICHDLNRESTTALLTLNPRNEVQKRKVSDDNNSSIKKRLRTHH